MNHNRRKYNRFKLRMDAKIISPIPLLAVLNEISVGGFRFQTNKTIMPQTEIRVTISIPFNQEIEIIGKVVWGREDISDGQNTYFMGVETKEMILPDFDDEILTNLAGSTEFQTTKIVNKAELVQEILLKVSQNDFPYPI